MGKRGGQIGRLAMREEGGMWVAYYALNHTMRDALMLGCVRMAFIVGNEDRKLAFMGMMREAVADIVEAKIGVRPDWGGEEDAPEHERAGNG